MRKKLSVLCTTFLLPLLMTVPTFAADSSFSDVAPDAPYGRVQKLRNRQSRQRLDRHGTIVVGSCETFHHYNVQGVK